MIVASEEQERWCGFCGVSVVPVVPVLLPAKRIHVDTYGGRHNIESKPRYVCPECGRASLRLCDRAATGRALKQKMYAT